MENAASVIWSLHRKISTVSPTKLAATICALPSAGDLLSSICQFPSFADLSAAFGELGLSAKRPSKHLGAADHWKSLCTLFPFFRGCLGWKRIRRGRAKNQKVAVMAKKSLDRLSRYDIPSS